MLPSIYGENMLDDFLVPVSSAAMIRCSVSTAET